MEEKIAYIIIKNVGAHGPDTRTPPSTKTAIERRLLEINDRRGREIFEPVVGTDFDSCQEAYDFYNLYSWEHGFGIRRGRSRVNTNKYRSMQDLVCQCAGKNDRENSSSCKIDCKAMVRLLRTKDHGWYVSMFVKEHNHRLSVGYDAKIEWNSHDFIDPISFDFIKNLRSNNVSVGKVYNILCGAEWNSQAVPYRKQVLRTLCAKFSQDTIKDDLTKTMKLLQDMKMEDMNLKVEIDVDGDGRVRTMLWVTGKNRQDYFHFGDVVTFDTTDKTNLYNMPFALFVGVNNHFQSIIFGGALMREETEAAFNWLFKTFVALMNDKHPVTILTDQALAMKGAIESALPNTKHRWCRSMSLFVPCCNRRVLGSCIERLQSIATRENKPMCKIFFVTREELEYEVMVDHGDMRTRIHGDGWHRFLDEYVVRPGDMVYICLPRGNSRFYVDVERDGVRQTPLPYLASNGLSLMKRELIDHCVYTRGIHQLEYSEMKKLIRCAFGSLEEVCCIFVHKMTGVDIKEGYMRIPKRAVDLIESNAGVLDDSGITLLHDDAGDHVTASFKKSKDGRLVIQGGFRKYVVQLEMKEDDLLVITFHKRAGSASMTVRVCILS